MYRKQRYHRVFVLSFLLNERYFFFPHLTRFKFSWQNEYDNETRVTSTNFLTATKFPMFRVCWQYHLFCRWRRERERGRDLLASTSAVREHMLQAVWLVPTKS